MSILKPCPMPMCGAPVDTLHKAYQGLGGFTYEVRCKCGLSFDTGAQSEAAAADCWNERPAPVDPRDLFIAANPCSVSDEELEKAHRGFTDMLTHGDYMTFLAGYEAAIGPVEE